MIKNQKTKILIILSAIGILILVLVMLLNINVSMVKTEVVDYETVANTINTKGYIIRNETYITNDTSGVVVYELPSGGSVAANGVIAKVYQSEADAVAHQKISKITQELDKLKKMSLAATLQGTSLESVNKTIHKNISTIVNNINDNHFYDLETNRNNLLYVINERQIMTGLVSNFNDRIAALEQEKSALQSSVSGAIAEIKSPIAGYFTNFTDGYENAYDYTKIKGIETKQLTKLEKKEPQKVAENIIGKVVSQLNWYIACPVTAEQAVEFNDIYGDVKIKMPYATTDSVPVSVVSVNQNSKKDAAVIVLECKNISDELVSLRNETVKINVQSYSGIKIPKQALHFDTVIKTIENKDGTTTTDSKNVEGVYVLRGNELKFKQVVTLFADEDFIICDTDPKEDKLFGKESGKETVELYDQVVIEGADLHAGKIVKQSS